MHRILKVQFYLLTVMFQIKAAFWQEADSAMTLGAPGCWVGAPSHPASSEILTLGKFSSLDISCRICLKSSPPAPKKNCLWGEAFFTEHFEINEAASSVTKPTSKAIVLDLLRWNRTFGSSHSFTL